ncbi:AAA ATPase central domain-containing protein [Tolypothrix sp. NIES-4075]|uniref:ATP-binding protein n=1 Tax=Tolypothrix sp. NIES-4075 TaxID=2005459 RepID=UPI000B6B01FF|nr:AAA family ATPase [Tolypothrix sp. NIES-4075]GAX45857.1 AAA ATPase central domain-containing protein [Tolypothrix sp. NIES-4075]
MNLQDLKTLIAADERVISVVAPVRERLTIFKLLHKELTPQLKLPMYLWNLGQGQQFKSVNYNEHDERVVITEGFKFGECDQSTPGQRAIATLKFIRELTHTGIFVLENLPVCMGGIDGDELKSLLINTYSELTATESEKVLILLVTDEMELPATLNGFVKTLELPLPTSDEIGQLISTYLPTLTGEKVESQEVAALTTAAAGLTNEDIKAGLRLVIANERVHCTQRVKSDREGASASEAHIAAQSDIVQETDLVRCLRRAKPSRWSVDVARSRTNVRLAQSLLNYKINRFASFNLNFIPEPPLYDFGGLDNLRQFIQDAKRDFAPRARAANIPLPKGCLLVGPPGTGKTLAANVSARELGFPLVSVDTGAVAIGGATYLKRLLTRVEACAPVLLYFDELDKLFTVNTISGEDSGNKQILGTLLTWLQDKQSPVFVVATLNRLDALPPELTRVGRFDEIFYVGFPTAIERKQILTLHASRFDERYQCPDSPLSESQWRILLGKTVNCTGAELARMVEKAARKLFHQSLPIQIGLQELLIEREAMVPLYVRDTDRILAIENRARYVAQPAAKDDTSIYAPPITTFWG